MQLGSRGQRTEKATILEVPRVHGDAGSSGERKASSQRLKKEQRGEDGHVDCPWETK